MATLVFLQTLILCFIITAVVSLQPIVSVDEIEDGGTFSVTCDVSRVGNIPSDVTHISLSIYRQTSQDTNRLYLAMCSSIYGTYEDIPHDREWTVECTGFNNGTNNINTMKIVLQVKDAVCQDAGVYQCHVNYDGITGRTLWVTRPQCVTSKSCVSLQTNQEGLVPVVSLQPIVSVNEIEDGGTFSVTCDASRVGNFPSDVTDIAGLTIIRQAFSDEYYRTLVSYGPKWEKEGIPPGRQWTVDFTGYNNGTNNRNTMKIVIQVNDAVYQDAGVYGCEVWYQGTYGISAPMSRQQSVTPQLGSLQPIVSVDEIEDGGTFSVTCDVSRVGSLSSGVTDIESLYIFRQTSQDTREVLLAKYSPRVRSYENIPPGREWTVEGTGYNNGTNNRNTMKLVLQVKDAVCQDAGVYHCHVLYHRSIGGTPCLERPQCVTSKSAVENITLDADNYFEVPGRPNYSEYKEGDNITLTCRIDGPQELEMKWKTGTYDTVSGFIISDYPNDNDITTFEPTFIHGTSGPLCQYGHKSVLNLRSLSQDVNDQVMYLCVVMDNDQFGAAEVSSANITVGIPST